MVDFSPKSFQDTPLADLCLEDALKTGSKRSENLKPTDFSETSIRFCVDGLKDWLSAYTDDYGGCSMHAFLRDISWQWASFCSTNKTMVQARKGFVDLRRDIAETSSYADLVQQMQTFVHIREFVEPSGRPRTVLLPLEVTGVIGQTAEALGIPSTKFIQVGWGWSLSTNQLGLYEPWIKRTFQPLFEEVMKVAADRVDVLEETRCRLEFRMCRELKKAAEKDPPVITPGSLT